MINCAVVTIASALLQKSAILFLAYLGFHHLPPPKHTLDTLSNLSTTISIQAKFKIIISFIQVVITLQPIYGLHMHSAFLPWFQSLQKFNFGLSELVSVSGSCYGSSTSMTTRLILNVAWPFVFVGLLIGGLLLHTIGMVQFDRRRQRQRQERSRLQRGGGGEVSLTDVMATFWSRSLYVTIVVFYLVLPSICRSIFDAVTCKQPPPLDDDAVAASPTGSDDRSVTCDKTEDNYKWIYKIFVTSFCIWCVAVPLLFLALLLSVRTTANAVIRRHVTTTNTTITITTITTPLATGCRFLSNEYKDTMILWEFVDVVRKILLTGLVIFIDVEGGNERILRLLVAIVICMVYSSIITIACPYKRMDDLNLAIISNMILTFCFVAGVIIHQCKETKDSTTTTDRDFCEQLFGLSFDSYNATLAVVALTATMLIGSVLYIGVLAVISFRVQLLVHSSSSTPQQQFG
mmetsp:Transcript_13594/g.16004  ORF Transcript_13594/g.16004 Transcript_13594/m.16004 type:complete len:461 (-) Transcript_13594:357-1739(-)|eukprot:CAMPEP_0198258232 /NCGR_PEP_ID=MMETSP1447-20131203/7721_1 /TAXON_ID=420782 /ORGANISM="Chaetoceros dichaeta, Strain CCMP1751" /LENGTH=460 /DNA_ID=CAMNT_0043945311 /DNA_START=108 /DNA_END=1490 /DNA_ORIENTATION=-